MQPEGARTLLDPEAVRRCARSVPALAGHRLGTVRARSFWVKPGRHFNACYRIEDPRAAGGHVLLSGFAVAPERVRRILASAGEHRCANGGGSFDCPACTTFRAGPDLVFQFFPSDYRLPTLPDCLDVQRVNGALHGAFTFTARTPAGYRPGMRCQIRYRGANGETVYGKVAVEREPGSAFAHARSLYEALSGDSGQLRLAQPLRYVEELGLTLAGGVPGESLHEAMRRGLPFASVLRAGAGLIAELHRCRPAGVERVYTPQDELALLGSWVDLAAELFPDMAPDLRVVEAGLIARRPPVVEARALVHRDFYDKQLLFGNEGLALLDLDTICLGDPEIDVGNFCAHFQLRGLQWRRREELERHQFALRDAYPGELEGARVGWYRSCTLLRLACVYVLRPHWRHVAPALVAEAGR